ncbi:MAG: hypothetical protein CM1200mP2_12910 [Planctomycetaceae bacterium]|nr:MAG: hypothetical protein CM1200mP2_12910 [Planctomycetaceae bacterium]
MAGERPAPVERQATQRRVVGQGISPPWLRRAASRGWYRTTISLLAPRRRASAAVDNSAATAESARTVVNNSHNTLRPVDFGSGRSGPPGVWPAVNRFLVNGVQEGRQALCVPVLRLPQSRQRVSRTNRFHTCRLPFELHNRSSSGNPTISPYNRWPRRVSWPSRLPRPGRRSQVAVGELLAELVELGQRRPPGRWWTWRPTVSERPRRQPAPGCHRTGRSVRRAAAGTGPPRLLTKRLGKSLGDSDGGLGRIPACECDVREDQRVDEFHPSPPPLGEFQMSSTPPGNLSTASSADPRVPSGSSD